MKKAVVEYRVPYADTDMMGVMYYANYFALFERGRNELMRECGYSYRQCEEEGFGLPVIHAEADYRGSARYDDLLEITAFISAVKGVRVEITCEIRRKGEEAVLVRGFTRHAFVDLKTFRPCMPTGKFKKALSEGME